MPDGAGRVTGCALCCASVDDDSMFLPQVFSVRIVALDKKACFAYVVQAFLLNTGNMPHSRQTVKHDAKAQPLPARAFVVCGVS